ncbi:MAG: hypothetical protein ACXVB9_17770 [Bdellovibrionota bacterium]
MKFALALLAFLSAPAFADGDFCVQTINSHATAWSSRNAERLEKMADTLKASEPCAAYHFQEIWNSGEFDTFSQLPAFQGLSFVYGDRLRRDNSMIGLASAYPGTLVNARSELYPVNNGNFGVEKGYILSDVKLASGQEFFFWNTHTNPRSDTNRISQAIYTADLFLTKEPRALQLPLILTGDLNDYPDSTELLVLQKVLLLNDSFFDVHGSYKDICTFCNDNPENGEGKNEILDFVLYRSSPTLALSPTRSEINLKNGVSDHYGVRSSFHFVERSPALRAANDPVVLKRMSDAVAALETAQKDLVKEGGEESVIQRAKELQAMIRDGRLPEHAKDLYRLP